MNLVYGHHNRDFWARVNNLDCIKAHKKLYDLALKLRDLEAKVISELEISENAEEDARCRPIAAAAEKLSDVLLKYGWEEFSVGQNEFDTIFVYEHVRGYAKKRTVKEFGGYKVVYEYVGRTRPALLRRTW